MLAALILGLLLFAMLAVQRGVRTRRVRPVAVGSACMLLSSVVMTLLSL